MSVLAVIAVGLLGGAVGGVAFFLIGRHAGFKEAATSILIAARTKSPQKLPPQTGQHAAHNATEGRGFPAVKWPPEDS